MLHTVATAYAKIPVYCIGSGTKLIDGRVMISEEDFRQVEAQGKGVWSIVHFWSHAIPQL